MSWQRFPHSTQRLEVGRYFCTSLCTHFLGFAAGCFALFSIFRRIRSSACGFLDSHFPSKQLFPIDIGNGPVHVGRIFEGDESVTLASFKPFRQANVGTMKRKSARVSWSKSRMVWK